MSSIESSTEVAPISPAVRLVVAAYISPAAPFRGLTRDTTRWPAFLLMILGRLVFCFAVQKQVG